MYAVIIMASIGIAALYISAYLAARGIDIGEPYAEADDLSRSVSR